MLMLIIIIVLGILTAYFGLNYVVMRKYNLNDIVQAIKKKKPYLFLESSSGYFPRIPNKMLDNVAFTEEGETIIIPAGTIKSCPKHGNLQIGHGDLYLSALIPMDLQNFIESQLDKGEEMDNIAEKIDRIASDEEEIPEKFKTDKKRKHKIYKTISFDNIRSFLNTGLNRTLLKRMISTLIERRNLKSMFGGKNWINIAIAIAVIVIVVGVMFMMLGNSGFFNGLVSAGAQAGSQVAP